MAVSNHTFCVHGNFGGGASGVRPRLSKLLLFSFSGIDGSQYWLFHCIRGWFVESYMLECTLVRGCVWTFNADLHCISCSLPHTHTQNQSDLSTHPHTDAREVPHEIEFSFRTISLPHIAGTTTWTTSYWRKLVQVGNCKTAVFLNTGRAALEIWRTHNILK